MNATSKYYKASRERSIIGSATFMYIRLMSGPLMVSVLLRTLLFFLR